MPEESLRSGIRHGSMTDCLFSGQGLEVPPRQTATGTSVQTRAKFFEGVGEREGAGGLFVQADCKLKRNTGLA